MKITVWVVSTCIPERGAKPWQPSVFGTEAEAEAYADEMLRGEWVNAGIEDEIGDDAASRPYPGNWREANSQLVAHYDDGSWGEWQITSHQIEIGTTPFAALEDAIRELDEAADKFKVIHHNHPGERAGRAQGEDKAFCAELSNRMRAARDRARAGLAAVEADRADAERWRALMSSQRMHWMGSAGFEYVLKEGQPDDHKTVNYSPTPRPGAPLHFGIEFWDVAEQDARYPDTFERELLTVYVDTLRERSK